MKSATVWSSVLMCTGIAILALGVHQLTAEQGFERCFDVLTDAQAEQVMGGTCPQYCRGEFWQTTQTETCTMEYDGRCSDPGVAWCMKKKTVSCSKRIEELVQDECLSAPSGTCAYHEPDWKCIRREYSYDPTWKICESKEECRNTNEPCECENKELSSTTDGYANDC